MGLQSPHVRIVWINNDVPATRTIKVAQAHPSLRCDHVPFGASNWAVAETNRCNGERRMKLNHRRGVEKRSERHDPILLVKYYHRLEDHGDDP